METSTLSLLRPSEEMAAAPIATAAPENIHFAQIGLQHPARRTPEHITSWRATVANAFLEPLILLKLLFYLLHINICSKVEFRFSI